MIQTLLKMIQSIEQYEFFTNQLQQIFQGLEAQAM